MNNISARNQQGFFSPIYTVRDTIYDGIQTGLRATQQVTSDTIQSLDLEPYKSVNNVFNKTMKTMRSDDSLLNIFINSIRGDWFRIILLVLLLTFFLIYSVFKMPSYVEPIKDEVTIKIRDARELRYVMRNNEEGEGEEGFRSKRLKPSYSKSTIEGMTNLEKNELLNNLKNGFCNTFMGDNEKLNTECMRLTKDVCKMTECCVYIKEIESGKERCVAGDRDGSIFKYKDDGTPINFDYYYYVNKCYGNCK